MWVKNIALLLFVKVSENKNSNIEFDYIITYIPFIIFYNEMEHQIWVQGATGY